MRSASKIGLVLLLCVAAFLLVSRDDVQPDTVIVRMPVTTPQPNPNIMAVAHRGAAKWAPENTLAALDRAIELGYPYFELDVRYTRDRIPVVMHDTTLDRTTEGSGLLRDWSLDELRQLDAGAWFGTAFADERVPTLAEALERAQGKICVIWDLKEAPDEATTELFRQYDAGPNCVLVTFGGFGVPDQESRVSRLLDYWPDAPLIGKAAEIADLDKELDAYPMIRAVKVNRRNIDAALVSAAHERDLLVLTSALGFFDHPKIYQRLIDAGVDIIMLDHFDVLNDYLVTGNVFVPLQDAPPNSGYYKEFSAAEVEEKRALAEASFFCRP